MEDRQWDSFIFPLSYHDLLFPERVMEFGPPENFVRAQKRKDAFPAITAQFP